MTNEHDVTGLLKIGELAKASGTSVSTVKYYVKEGLVRIAKKTGRNMAYYHPDSVQRVRMIKALQKEKYYPLSVIKHLLEKGEPGFTEIELYDVIHKVDHTAPYRPLTLSAAIKETGLSRSQIEALEKAGLVTSVLWENKRVYRESDCRIMILVKHREDAGIPFSQTLASFRVYQQNLSDAVKADVNAIISEAIVPESPSTSEIVHMIRVSDQTLDEFVSLKRYELNRIFGSQHIDEISIFSDRLKTFLSAVRNALSFPDGQALQALCDSVLRSGSYQENSTVSEALREYGAIIRLSEEGLAESITACNKANHFFDSLHPGTAARTDTLLLHALRLGWFTLAPDVLLCQPRVSAATAELERVAQNYGQDGQAFLIRLSGALKGETS